MTNRVVVTGFRAFPGVPENPSQRVIEFLRDRPALLPESAELKLLDVSYAAIGSELDTIFADPPTALVLTGYSKFASGITLEMQATDACDPDKPDAMGFAPSPSGREPACRVNEELDFTRLDTALTSASLPHARSRDAGAYLCNHSYHGALQRIAAGGCATQAIFVHIPAIAGSDLAQESALPMSLEDLARGVAIVASELS